MGRPDSSRQGSTLASRQASAPLERIAPRQKQRWAYDTDTRGLALLVSPKGAKTFYLARRIEGATAA
jgi:hypothetical protein